MKLLANYHRNITAMVIAALLTTTWLSTPSAFAQSSETKEKIALMSAALRARDAGDLNVSKEKLEELLRINPDDSNVQNLLAAVNQDIERQGSGQPTVFGQAADVTSFEPGGSPSMIDPGNLDSLLEAEASAQKEKVAEAKEVIAAAKKLIKVERYSEAEAMLANAQSQIPLNTATAFVLEDIQELRGKIMVEQGEAMLADNNLAGAKEIAEVYQEKLGSDDQLKAYNKEIKALETDPWKQDPAALSPDYVENQSVVDELIVQGRAMMLYGDYQGAVQKFREAEARDPTNATAKGLQVQVNRLLEETAYLDHKKTRVEMMEEVARSWQRPQVFERDGPETDILTDSATLLKIRSIEIPNVKFSGVPLSRVVETLSELSVEYDFNPYEDPADRGINIIRGSSLGEDPLVSITLRSLNLEKILDFTLETVGYQWNISNDVVVVTKGGGDFMETEFFPISRGVVIRLTGVEDGGGGGGGAVDPFAPAAPTVSAPSANETESALKSFFQRAGIDFDGTPNSSLAFDGTQLIVTQTARNLEKLRNILRRYDQPKQVEIEAKFMEVNQGALDELGFDWNVRSGSVTTGFDASGNAITVPKTDFSTNNRTLSNAFAINRAGTLPLEVVQGGQSVVGPIDLAAPSIPNAIELGTGAGSIFSTFGIINGVNVDLLITALSREEGSDLLSSPRLTVLSGRTAQIVVAQELRYPESYGDIESEVGTGNANGGGSAGVTITAGTPQDFTVRNVGVEMEVTPTVEENENISLKLEPRVTEFEGFVEYGGPSIAISGATTVTVPSGFFQPIFSTRTVRTEVTVYDGATVVIGGLVREEILTVNDKVPVLADIPLIGRLFQTKGESSQKRNLLIFVTANLISPGGSPQRQRLRNVEPNQLFQNPIIVTPGGGVSRELNE